MYHQYTCVVLYFFDLFFPYVRVYSCVHLSSVGHVSKDMQLDTYLRILSWALILGEITEHVTTVLYVSVYITPRYFTSLFSLEVRVFLNTTIFSILGN